MSALFFPQVLYQGTRIRDGTESPMLHWLVLCRLGDIEAPSPEFWPNEYLSRASVAVRDEKTLAWAAQTGEECSEESPPNAVEWLSQHGTGILRGLRRS